MPLTKADIAALIPHSGAMCLLDGVTSWDDTRISAWSRTHLDPDNPLRSDGAIPSLSAIEYAAQAMATHGALAGSIAGRPRAGYLVSLRGVVCLTASLDDFEGDLSVDAERVAGDMERVMYSFSLRIGEAQVLSGKATVVLDAGTGPS